MSVIGGAKHPADVLRPTRPVQPDGCESFRHRCLLPEFQSMASTLCWNVCRLSDSPPLLLFIEPSGVPVCSFGGVLFLVAVWGCFARRGDETRQRWELGNSSAGQAFGPTECSASAWPTPCSSRMHAGAPELESRRCRRAYGRIELPGAAKAECRVKTVWQPDVRCRSPAHRAINSTNGAGTITGVGDACLRDSDISSPKCSGQFSHSSRRARRKKSVSGLAT